LLGRAKKGSLKLYANLFPFCRLIFY